MSYADIRTAARNLRASIELDGEYSIDKVDTLLALIAGPVTVQVVTINHRYGVNTYVHSNRGDAMDSVYNYVTDWWASEMVNIEYVGEGEERRGVEVPVPMPLDKAAVISEYFERMYGDEDYNVEEVTIGF